MIIVAPNFHRGREEAVAHGRSLSQVILILKRFDLYKLQGVGDDEVVWMQGWGERMPEAEWQFILDVVSGHQGSVVDPLT